MPHTKVANRIKLTGLSQPEMEVITGCLLGDGTLSMSGKCYRLRIEHTVRHREYVEWKHYLLQRLSPTLPQYNMRHAALRFGTVGHPAISQLRGIWYEEGRKRVTATLHLTPLMVAIWFMDDGTRHGKTVDFSTHNFAMNDLMVLQRELMRFGIEATINSDGKGNRMYVRRRSYPSFERLVKPYVLPCMAYKLP